jgi:hypothetical protein
MHYHNNKTKSPCRRIYAPATSALRAWFLAGTALAAVAVASSGEDRARAVAGYFVIAHLGFSAVPLAVGLAVDALGVAPALAGLWCMVAGVAALLVPRLLRRGGAISRSG